MNLKAYGKINIGLRIIRKRSDGYHDIETIFHRINVYDEIILEEDSNISLKCDDPAIPIDDSNLCIKTAKLLKEFCRTEQGVKIFLKKNIPIGAGLGGGSSDAASVLLNLPKLWNINITHEELERIASRIGADVTYFLKKGSAYTISKGDDLEYFHLDIPYTILTIYPDVHVSTAWAYQNYKIKNIATDRTLKDIVNIYISDPLQLKKNVKNDFEEIVFQRYPDLQDIKDKLYDKGAKFAQMSGSGSSIFGFFDTDDLASEAEELFAKENQTIITPPHFIGS